MYRLTSIAIVLVWVGAMTALFMRDVYPAWTAQDAPPMTKEHLAKVVDRDEQLGIFGEDGSRRGTAWSSLSGANQGGNTSISGTVLLEGFGVVRAVLIETVTEFEPQGELDSFDLSVLGVPMTTIRVHGERHGIYFPCELQVGPMFRQANLESAATRLIGDAFRPFSYLPTLKVGQSWRMQVVDPISMLGGGARFTPVVARVTGQETIAHNGKPVECFVVESSPGQAKAWVGPGGKVFLQQMTVPGLGRMTVLDEPFDGQARQQARQLFRYDRSTGDGKTSKRNLAPVEQGRESISNAFRGGRHDGNH
jgi:hypothetical protein